MSKIKVNSLEGVGASTPAISIDNASGTCTANITNNLSNRNLIINGAMKVAQRGTSQNTISASGYYTVDRWNTNVVNPNTFRLNQAQSTQSPDGFSNSLSYSVGSGTEKAIAANERIAIEQRLEAQDLQKLAYGTSSAKSFTLSFYVRSSRAGQYGINIRQHDAGKDYNEKFDISSINTWERKTITVSGNTGDTITNDNGLGLWFRILLRAGSNHIGNVNYQSWGTADNDKVPAGQQTTWGTSGSDDFYLTGVQLELGSVATDFEHRSFAQELPLCQRYFYPFLRGTDNYENIALGYTYSSSAGMVFLTPPVEMRDTPTFSASGTFGANDGTDDTALTFGFEGQGSTRGYRLTITNFSTSVGRGFQLRAHANTTSRLDLSAEL